MKLVGLGHKVAVIPVDPSSQISGGSILGDKTRMEQLSRSEQAYVRASPTRCMLGGIAEYTSDVVSVCESAGYDTVIVESVGLGQSETELDQAVDLFVLVIPPVAGDDLQASKKGIMEVADVVVVNKADGDLVPLARQTVCDYASSVRFIRPKHADWSAKIMMLSARTGVGVDEFIGHMKTFSETMTDNRGIARKRGRQAKYWMWAHFQRHILDSLHSDDRLKAKAHSLEASLESETATPRAAAEALFEAFLAEKAK
jgi:LAO/AO transport system kinase